MSNVITDTVTHLAGPRIDVCGRIIQRCSVCGTKLCDSLGAMMPVNRDGSPPVFPTFPEDRMIQVTLGQNPTRYLPLPPSDKLPPDACILMGMVED